MRRVTSFEMAEGEQWALRASKGQPFKPVEVVKLGNASEQHLRVRVADLSEGGEGRERWVPVSQLKAPWSEHQRLVDEEERWSRLRSADPVFEHVYAAYLVFDHLADVEKVIDVHYNLSNGIGEVVDPDALAKLLGWQPDSFIESPGAFIHEGHVLVHWDMTQKIAQTLVQLHRSDTSAWIRDRLHQERRALLEKAQELHYENFHVKQEDILEILERRDPDFVSVEDYVLGWLGEREEVAQLEVNEMRQRQADFLMLSFDIIYELRTKRTKRADALVRRVEQFAGLRAAD